MQLQERYEEWQKKNRTDNKVNPSDDEETAVLLEASSKAETEGEAADKPEPTRVSMALTARSNRIPDYVVSFRHFQAMFYFSEWCRRCTRRPWNVNIKTLPHEVKRPNVRLCRW